MAQPEELSVKQLFYKARVLRVLATAFATLGLIMFSFLAYTKVSGEGLAKLLNPDLILVLLIPFLPAFFLSVSARRAEKRMLAMAEKRDNPQAPALKVVKNTKANKTARK